MKILLTNDDGISSVGIQTMAKHLAAAGHDIVLVAPDRECSGCGHAMTIGRPLEIKEENLNIAGSLKAYACSGTPTDCVIMAVDVIGAKPDVLISGINQGPNLADDLTYSGTACAAMEGVIFGLPSIAVSLNCDRASKKKYNDDAAQVVLSLLEWIKKNPIPAGVMYNVNVPNAPLSKLAGVKATVKGIRRYTDKITKVKTDSGSYAYWIGGTIEDEMTEGTDVWAISRGYVSITPVHLEMTSFAAYENCRKLGMDEDLTESIRRAE